MIQKFISIRNIGSFEACSASGDVELRRLTVLSAENGRGKTTICDLLRSIKTGDPSFVQGRTRLGGQGRPSVRLLVEGQTIDFDGAAWTETLPGIEIFDSTFVCRNVFSGDVIDHDHKKNLYQVIVGERGVALAQRVTELDGQSREASRSITEAENHLRALLPRATQLDAFLALHALDGLDQRISEKKEELDRARRSEEIGTYSSFTLAPVPTVLAGLDEILQAVAGVAPSDSLEQIERHISQHTAHATEDWLSTGTSFVQGTECPYCGQSLEGLLLFDAYRAVFQESYRRLISSVDSMISQAERVGEAWSLDRQTHVLELNAERGRFWTQFGVEVPQAFPIENLEVLISDYRVSLLEALNSKLLSPFDPVVRPAGLTAVQEQVQFLSEAVQEYNQRVQVAIRAVESVKAEVGRADVGVLQSQLASLEMMKLRQDPEVSGACDAVNRARAAKQRVEEEKENTKTELDEYADNGFPGFEQGINDLLEDFGANFRISGTRRSYVGGRPSSSFRIAINDVDVELGDSSTSPAEPSFRNTLSSGDKSTLALAFFLQKLEHDQRLAEKIVVLDDPFSSQDRSRRTCTMQRALRIAERAKQVLVLSHEPAFLKALWDTKGQIPSKALQLTRIGISATTITEWDIEEAGRTLYHKDLRALQSFLNLGGGELIDVVRKIRPVIEGFLRFSFYGVFQDHQWLGDFIALIRAAPQGTPLFVMNDQVAEIEAINDFSKKYHHAQNPNADNEPIDEGEVRAFVRRTLRLVSAV